MALIRTLFVNVVLDEVGLIGLTLRPPFDVIFKGGEKRTEQRIQSLAAGIAEHVGKSATQTLAKAA